MEVDRYSSVLFVEALFAQLWAMRWLVEIALTKLPALRVRRVERTTGMSRFSDSCVTLGAGRGQEFYAFQKRRLIF